MKLASYNIMIGGFDAYTYDSLMPERLAKLQAVIQEIDADVIGLVDTFRWDTTFSIEELKNIFGYNYIERTNLNDERFAAGAGKSIGVTLMSKYPWKDCHAVRLDSRDALKAEFTMGDKTLTVFLAYLDDLSEDTRLAQTRALLAHVDEANNTIIMGDLNTISRADVNDSSAATEQFYKDNPEVAKNLTPIVQDMQRGEVIALLESCGMKDIGAGKGATMPTKLFPAAVTGPLLRVDYCLAGSTISISDFRVHASAATDAASDHLPISFTAN